MPGSCSPTTRTSFGSLQYFQLGQGGKGDSTANGLEPEKAKTYEIGTRYDDGHFAGELTAFYIDFDDELQYISNEVGWTNLGRPSTRASKLPCVMTCPGWMHACKG